ncbi:MAG: hypothetical protein IPK17_15775, partial [Chloroflexi bacterium]|nr:hypothetical protein [Chloroflexota bacterium]
MRRSIASTAQPGWAAQNMSLLAKARLPPRCALWMVGDNAVIVPETLAGDQTRARLQVDLPAASPIVFSQPIDNTRRRRGSRILLASDYYHGMQWLELGAKRMEYLPLSAATPTFITHMRSPTRSAAVAPAISPSWEQLVPRSFVQPPRCRRSETPCASS